MRLGSQDVAEAKAVLTELLFAESLLLMDSHGRPAPWLATGWQWQEAGRALEVRLRPDVTFHDGTPLTAQTVAAIMRQRVKADPLTFEYVTAIEATGSHTLVFRLSRADAFLLGALAGTAIVDDHKPDNGTGPFRILSRAPIIQAERNLNYYRGTPGIDRIQVVTYDTQRAAWAAMMRGDVDMVQEVNREVVEFLEGSSRFDMYSSIRPFYIPLVFNLRHPILRHVEVRRALAEAINRAEIVREVMRGHGQIADDPVWPSHWAYNSAARTYPYNPQSARIRLDAAGFPARRSDSGMTSRFQLKCLFYNKDFQFERIALLLQRQLAEVDVELVLEGADQRAIVNNVQHGNFDSYLFQLTSGKSFDWTYRFWHSAAAGAAAFQDSGYSGADGALDRLRGALQDSDVRTAVADLRQRFHEDVPAAFLAWPETTRAVDARFDIGDRSNPDIFASLWRWRAAGPDRGTR